MVETPRRRADQRGIAAVEAGLVTMFLAPMLLGVLWFGDHFWQQQDTLRPRVTQSDVVGVYTSCADLLEAVRNTVLVNVNNVSRHTDVHADDVTARVLDFVPGALGVDVRVDVSADARATISGNPVALQSRTDIHLENVRLDAQTC